MQLVIIEDKARYQTSLTKAELAERERRPVPFHVLINPEIEFLSPPDTTFFEGCLSLPGFVTGAGGYGMTDVVAGCSGVGRGRRGARQSLPLDPSSFVSAVSPDALSMEA